MTAPEKPETKGAAAILIFAHVTNENVHKIVDDLRSISDRFNIFMVGYSEQKQHASTFGELSNVSGVWIDREDIERLDYKAKISSVKDWKTLFFARDLPILAFFRKHSGFRDYWIVEYDVLYTGNWSELFTKLNAASSADLLGIYLTPRPPGDEWIHWKDFHAPGVEEGLHTRSFLPLCRVSGRLLREIEAAYSRGWSGHAEAIWPTVARANGMLLEEIGGEGPWTPASRRDQYYHATSFQDGLFLGTFQARPTYRLDSDFFRYSSPRNLLWHPVK